MIKFKKYKNYYILPSKDKKKKYTVFKLVDGKLKKHLSFGARAYEQYHDQIGFYKNKDHWDKKRRDNYFARHHKGETNKTKALKQTSPKSALWWSSKFLW